MATLPAVHRFTAAEFQRMGQTGVFGEDSRLELIEGEVVEMAPIGPEHANRVARLNELLVLAFAGRAIVNPGNPLLLDPHSEPEPDFALLKPRPGGYAGRHPVPEDVLLIVEVADTSLLYDRQRKVPLYARHGIPEVWLVSLPEQTVTVYQSPAAAGYQVERELRRGEALAPLAFADREFATADLLG